MTVVTRLFRRGDAMSCEDSRAGNLPVFATKHILCLFPVGEQGVIQKCAEGPEKIQAEGCPLSRRDGIAARMLRG